jgi:copper transporter 1
MIGIFFMAALYEGLKYYREYLFWKTYNALQYRAVTLPEKGVVSEDNQIVQPTMLSVMHFYQTGLHMIQMVLSYFLMLIFMTYNVWLCLAVVVGAGVGYFLFGWKKSVIVDVTEHCH